MGLDELLGRVAGRFPRVEPHRRARAFVLGLLADCHLIAPGRVATPFWDPGGGPPEGALLSADQIANSIVWAISQPSVVDVNTVIVRPIGQPG